MLGLDPDNDDHFDRCEDELVSIAREAKFDHATRGGLLEYRGAVLEKSRSRLSVREHRLTLLVSSERRTEGNLPQLVTVKLRGH
jgi:hypothetical protein